MIPKRLASTIATGLWVAGALLVGNALHISVVTGEVPITAPAPVFYTIAGIALILIGQNLDVHPSEYLDYLESDEEEDAEAEAETKPGPAGGEFDEAASPLDEEAVANLEARERERDRRDERERERRDGREERAGSGDAGE